MARTVTLTLDARVSGLVSGIKTASKATQDYARELEGWRKKNEAHLDTIGDTAGKAGLAAAAGLAMVGKAAIDWESAWTGVLKTVDGTPEQLGAVEDGLRGLARTLPATHTEIAAVAEAAGQLGVKTPDVVDFTKTMINLGESTNLSADEAATSLARFANITGSSLGDVDKLGSTLVGLGNSFATTEAEIMAMSMRLSGAGVQIGLSEGQIMGLSAAMSSVGIEAEAGGSAMSLTMKRIGKSVDTGGEALDLFAKTAGMTSSEFSAAWKDDAGSALESFVIGLGKAGESGESVNGILSELGITGIRESDALLRLSSAGELMGDAMMQGAQEYESGMALIEEANKRYATTESRIKIAWNNIKDAAIEAGAVILPVVADMADAVAGLAQWFGNLPPAMSGFLTVLGTVGAVAGLGVSGVITFSRKLGELREAMGGIVTVGGRSDKAIRGVGKALSAITIVGAGLIIGKQTIEAINDAARSGRPDLEEYFNILATGGNLSDTLDFDLSSESFVFPSSAVDSLKEYYGAHTEGAAAAKRALEFSGQNTILQWFGENLGMGDVRDAADDWLELAKAGDAIARAFSMGEADLGIDALKSLQSELELTDENVAQLINNVPSLKDALMALATENGIQIDPNDELGLVDLALGRIEMSAPGATEGIAGVEGALEGAGAEAEETAASLDDIIASMFELGRETRSVIEAEDALTNSLSALDESVEKNGRKFKGNSEEALANRAALLGVATEMETLIEAQARGGASSEEIQGTMRSTYDAMMEATGGSEELVRSLLSIPPGVDVDTWMSEQAQIVAESTAEAIEAIPGYTKVSIAVSEDGTTGQVQSKINEVSGKTEYVFVTDDGTVQNVQAGIASIDGKDVPVYVGDDGTVYSTQGKINGIKGKDVTITADAATSGAESELNHTARDRTSRVTQTVSIKRQISESVKQIDNGPITGRFGRANGGSVFGPGTETSDSIPAWLSTNEHVLSAREVRGLGGHGSVERLRAMARNGQAPAFATGGAVGRAEKRVKDLQKSYSAIDSKKANRARKQAAKARLDDAKADLKAAKSQAKLSAAAAKDAREKASRLSEAQFDLRRDLKRGSITDSFTSGSGMSVVDRLFEQSNNKDLSRGQRSNLRSLAYSSESQLLKLEKRSESLTKRLDAAVKRRDELLSVKNQTRDQVLGSFDLGSLSGQKDQFGYQKHVGKKGLLSYGKSLASGAKKLHGKVQKLQKLGFNENMLQQVIDEWTQGGTFELADAMLSMNKSERGQFNRSFRSLESYGLDTGESLTNAMSKGGIDAAQGLVSGLESQRDKVDSSFYKLGKSAEKAFKKSLGIKSPSRVMMAAGVNVGEGAELGILSKIGDVQSAAEQLMAPPALMVPPSFEVSRHAQAQAMPAVAFDYDKLAAAMANVQVVSPVNIDKNTAARVVQVGSRQASRLQ
ncbi:phage tail tape measure protein [Glutamicibacter arilaitensis]|uniref:phage tail tape measure protein n=1 Tax=Glutamicibacter arilaitensis TaxID=256701 RepID=UPI003F93B8A3